MNKWGRESLLAIIASVMLASTGWAQQPAATSPHNTNQQTSKTEKATANNSGMKAADKQFMIKAAQGGMMEVEMGKLATEKAASNEVKQFGQQMVTDHSKANDELKQLAGQKGVTLPTQLDAKNRAMMDHFGKMSGEQFDKMYMDHMVKDHVKDVAEFKHESQKASDTELKAWAAKTLPTLENHLTLAQTTDANIKASKTGTNKTSSKTNSKANTNPSH